MQGEIRKTAWRHAEWGDWVCTTERSRGRGRGLRRSRATIMKMKEGLNDEGNVWWRGIEGERGSRRIFSWASWVFQRLRLVWIKKKLQSFFCMFPLLNWALTCDALQTGLLYAFSQSPLIRSAPGFALSSHHLRCTTNFSTHCVDTLKDLSKKKLFHKHV